MAVGVLIFPNGAINSLSTLIEVSDNAITQLTSSLGASDTTINVLSTTDFPVSSLLVIDNEKVTYTGKTSTSFTGVTRGAFGTTATTHLNGVDVEILVVQEHHNGLAQGIINIETSMRDNMLSLIWGSPSSEVSNVIEVTATIKDFVGNTLSSDLINVEVKVSDAANDAEPSATAILGPASSPVGTMLAGNGTATGVFQTNSSGQFRLSITETTPSCDRYLWIKAGGHQRYYLRSTVGILQLTFA